MSVVFSSPFRWVALTLGFLGQFSNSVAFQSVAPLAPLFQPELGLTKTEVGLFASILFAGQLCALLPAGGMVDRFGIRSMLGAGLLIMGGSLLSVAWIHSYQQALICLFVAGVGSAGVLPSVTKAIAEWFAPGVRGTMMGLKQAAVPVGGAITAAVLPAVAISMGWRYAMASVGVVGLVGGVATFAFYRDASRAARTPAKPVGMMEGLRVVARNRRLWQLSLFSVLFVTVQLALTSYVALFLEEVVLISAIPDGGARVVAAGGYLAICQIGGALGRVFWGAVSDRVFRGRRMVVLGITGIITVVCSLLTALMTPDFPMWLIPVTLFAFGASAVGWNGLYHTAMTETAGNRYAGTGVGLSMTLNQIGTFGGPPLFGFVVDATGSYQASWILMAAIALLGTLMTLLNGRTEPSPVAEPASGSAAT